MPGRTSVRFDHAILVAILFVLAVHLAPAQDKPLATPTPEIIAGVTDDTPLKVQTDLVTLTLTVHDKWGRYVSNLAKKHFSVFEDGVEQEITFFSDVDSPASIGIIYDISGSMGSGKIERSRRALERFLQTSHPADEFSLITFNDKVQLLADRTRNGNEILDKTSLLKARGSTALYDAVYLGVDRVIRGSHNKRALLIISDGQDNRSRFSYPEVRRYLKEADVIIYSVGILDGNDPLGFQGESFLKELSDITGGRSFLPRGSDELDEIFERIALELRHQYSIGYIPKDFRQDGKWRRLKVRVAPPRGLPRLSVRAREGYFATPLVPNR